MKSKKIIKIVVIVIALIFVIGFIKALFSPKKLSIEEIVIDASTIELDISKNDSLLSVPNNIYAGTAIIKGDNFDKNYDIDELEIVSDNSTVANISFDEQQKSDDVTTINFTITGVSKGETNMYIQTTDENVKSNSVKISVTNYKEDLDSLVNKPLSDAVNKIKELGLTAKYYNELAGDRTEDVAKFNEEQLNEWAISEIKELKPEEKTVTLVFDTPESIKLTEEKKTNEKILEDKLSSGHAWQAVKEYGENEYPYGFKVHYIKDVKAQYAKDQNTWYLKATCTVTNMYNAKQELTCEAEVSGTNDNPKVEKFNVF